MSNSDKKKLRLFVSIDMPEPVQQLIASIQQQLHKSSIFTGTLIKPADAHLTLHFLGSITETNVSIVIELLNKIKMDAFTAYVGNIGVFPTHYHTDILYLNLINPVLAILAEKVQTQLIEYVPRESRPWLSHVTIARIKKVYDRLTLLAFLQELQVPSISFDVTEFALKQSQLSAEGPNYTTLARFALQ